MGIKEKNEKQYRLIQPRLKMKENKPCPLIGARSREKREINTYGIKQYSKRNNKSYTLFRARLKTEIQGLNIDYTKIRERQRTE